MLMRKSLGNMNKKYNLIKKLGEITMYEKTKRFFTKINKSKNLLYS